MYPDKSATKLTNLYSEKLKGHLDLSEYKDLEELRCSSNELTSMDISKNAKLKKLDCSNNKLKEIDLENLPSLVEFNCSNNQLTKTLGIDNCNELSSLIFNNNKFSDSVSSSLKKITELNQLKGQ